MEPVQNSNHAPKRRRLHHDSGDQIQDWGDQNPASQYHDVNQPHIESFTTNYFYPPFAPNGLLTTSYPNYEAAHDANLPTAIYQHTSWSVHSFQSQNLPASMIQVQNNNYQPNAANQWPPSSISPDILMNTWPSNFPVPQGHLPMLTSTLDQSHLITGAQPGYYNQLLQDPFSRDGVPQITLYDHTTAQVNNESLVSPSVQQVSLEPTSEITCFGTVPCISAKCDLSGVSHIAMSPFAVCLDSSTSFFAKDYPEVVGQISSEYGQMIHGLLDEKTLDFYISCAIDTSHADDTQKAPRASIPISCMLEITVYGPLELFDEIGTWFEEYQVCLQDPRECHLDAKYYNPHRLSSDSFLSCPLVSEVVAQKPKAQLESMPQQHDLLDMLSSHDDLEEASQPTVVRQELRRHQKQALTFMLRREQGWSFQQHEQDVWEIMDTDQGRFFLNRISNAHQSEEPPQCCGGIVADPMGLGKSLTMIALIATDLDSSNTQICNNYTDVAATLIVVPPALMGTWEGQLSEHVIEGGLAHRRHHRETRISSIDELTNMNIVLTTYHTVSAEWSPRTGTGGSILFSVRWRRVILDEAHLIRNDNSKMSQAVCALESNSRWAVTGTPIQNRLGDFATLFKFIRAYPYTDRRCFDTDISRLWKTGEYQEAIKRLKRLSACLLLRRPKGTVSLPPRHDMQCPVEFSEEERALYNKLREQAIVNIDKALKKDFESSRVGMYVNVLQQIESLRLVCNLGMHYHTRHSQASQTSQETKSWISIAQRAFNVQQDMGHLSCLQCSSAAQITEPLLEDPDATEQSSLFFSCLRFFCADCMQNPVQAATCGHNPTCPKAQVSTSVSALDSSLPEIQPWSGRRIMNLPSKVQALMADIKTLPPKEKCIVFSIWRFTLDIVEAGLEQSSLRSVRFDGKVPQKERQNTVDRFRTDPDIRVMLLTLSCGAAGLTLTEATRAYLMEPHWNPTLEEQALARIHRIGQKQEVTTVRLYVRDSFEQRVMEVQESKKYLADLLLSPHENGHADENLGRLQKLISLI